MYRCINCHGIFGEPDTKEVFTGVVSGGSRESFFIGICPICGEEDSYDKVKKCACGEFEIEPLCTACQKRALKKVRDIIYEYAKTEEQIEYLKEFIAEEI